MDLNRLSPELADGLERARPEATRQGVAYIQPWHLFAVLLDEGGALARIARSLPADAAGARAVISGMSDADAPRLEPGYRPIAGRRLRDLLDRAYAAADAAGRHTVGALDVAWAAVQNGADPMAQALAHTGWSSEALLRVREEGAVLQPADGDPEPEGSVLARFSSDLTAAARAGRLAPVVGRDAELRSVVQTLLRRSKSNPVLVGDPGTGKTAVVEALAMRIVDGDVPESLRACTLLALDLTALVAGAKYRGEFEERVKALVDEVRGRSDVILFLDEIHTLIGAGGPAGGLDAANILKPALARGELRCIGASTHDEYRESIEKDAALARRFQTVVIEEPDDASTLAMLEGARGHYERHHGLRIRDDALRATVRLARRHLRDRFFPDKAFDVLDEASARIRAQRESRPDEIDQLAREVARLAAGVEVAAPEERAAAERTLEGAQARLSTLEERWREEGELDRALSETRRALGEARSELERAESAGDVARAAEVRYGTLKYLEEQERDLDARWTALMAEGSLVPREVGPAEVAAVIARRARVPLTRVLEGERERLLHLEERLGGRVLGQAEAVSAVSEAVRRMRADLRARRKPASFLFVGPTGVGKTELAKALADALFDDESALIRIDMAEYREAHSVSGLIGSRPGLVGSERGGFLTEQVRRAPHSVVLFDEIEKGHPGVIDLLLGVLDEGRLTDAQGRFCDFSNTILLLTSNLGVQEANAASDDPEERRRIILDVVERSLRPELFNRLSGVIAFNALGAEEVARIVSMHLGTIGDQLREQHGAELVADAEAVEWLAELAHDPAYGARPVERTVDRYVLADLSRLVLSGAVAAGHLVRLQREGDELALLAGTPEEVAGLAAGAGA